MKVLGCTGGIGSGKTYVANIFGKMGVPVYCSDRMAKELYDRDTSLKNGLAELLGEDILENGRIRRGIMAGKIFSSAQLLQKTEELVHPAVMRDFREWKEAQRGRCDSEFVIMESALILQKPLVRSAVDKVLVICAPLELRIKRVIKRDNAAREDVLKRMRAQMSEEKMIAMADFTIFADEKQALLPQIMNVYEAMKCL